MFQNQERTKEDDNRELRKEGIRKFLGEEKWVINEILFFFQREEIVRGFLVSDTWRQTGGVTGAKTDAEPMNRRRHAFTPASVEQRRVPVRHQRKERRR